ncbi:MAG: glycosyltransferase family 2 protein [Acidobacteriota bacterium]
MNWYLVAKIVFWSAALVVVYTYVAYPLLIMILAGWLPHRYQRKPITPTISIVIAAYNAANEITDKLASCFTLDYPASLIEVIVVSDGSTDETETIVKRLLLHYPNLTLICLRIHNGKATALNVGIATAKGEIVIFTDARQRLAVDAARNLVANFADPNVGAVSGELIFIDERQRPQMGGVDLYWRYERWLRQMEAQIHSSCGATGALYAVRRNLLAPIPDGLVLDDLLIPMRVVLAGYRIVFDTSAHAYDYLAANAEAEFVRKVRTLYGNYQLLVVEPRLWKPWTNPIFWQFFSHKICRLLVPFCLLLLFTTNLVLTSGVYLVLLVLQIGWYLLALIGHLLRKENNTNTRNYLNSVEKA